MTVLRTSQHPHESWVTMYQLYCTTASESQHIKTQKGYAGKGCWPHPRVRSLSWGGPGGHCRYPEDRVPPRTSIKSRQRLPPPAPDLRPPCVPAAPAPDSRQHRGRHVPPRLRAASGPPHVTWAPAPTFWRRAALELPRVTWALRAASK
jgi:hypothetical protein